MTTTHPKSGPVTGSKTPVVRAANTGTVAWSAPELAPLTVVARTADETPDSSLCAAVDDLGATYDRLGADERASLPHSLDVWIRVLLATRVILHGDPHPELERDTESPKK